MKAVELWTEAAKARNEYLSLATRAARGERVDTQQLAILAKAVVEAERQARAQQAREHVTRWRPPAAPHVEGEWTDRVFDERGMPEPQLIKMRCEKCGETWQTQCTSGLVRNHIQRFALIHLHRDVLNHVPKKIAEDEESNE
jgi:hypothetical protein